MYRAVVVEDDPDAMDIACRYVELDGDFAVAGRAGDGAEAAGLVRRLDPDLLVLDVYIPKRNGLDLLADLRRTGGAGEGTAVLFLTAADDPESMQRARDLGAVDYLVKPVGPARFRQALARCRAALAARGTKKEKAVDFSP